MFGDRGTCLCPSAHRKGLLGCGISKPWGVLVAKGSHARSLNCSTGVGFGLETEAGRGNTFFGSFSKSSARHAGCAFSRWLFLVASPLLPVLCAHKKQSCSKWLTLVLYFFCPSVMFSSSVFTLAPLMRPIAKPWATPQTLAFPAMEPTWNQAADAVA